MANANRKITQFLRESSLQISIFLIHFPFLFVNEQ